MVAWSEPGGAGRFSGRRAQRLVKVNVPTGATAPPTARGRPSICSIGSRGEVGRSAEL